jgi:predicted ATPase
MAYITKVLVENCRNVERLEVDLTAPGRPRHLILTGPNGSGKSGVLAAIATEVQWDVQGADKPLQHYVAAREAYRKQANAAVVAQFDQQVAALKAERPATLSWDVPLASLAAEFSGGRFISVYLDVKRLLEPAPVSGPTKLVWAPNQLNPSVHVAAQFLQFLVNKKTEQAFASSDRDEVTAQRIEAWFDDFWKQVGRLLEDEGLTVKFDRQTYNFVFTRRDGHPFDLRTLADGHAAVLSILAEILLRVDAAERASGDRTKQPSGVVIIDEIETHLHLKLQEDILPFLSALFPEIQFILATHSPVVMASIPHAVVYDFGKREASPSEEFRGIRYGALMTGHFGIPDDIDLDTLEKLREMRALAAKTRDADEDEKLTTLATELAGRSASMALEVFIATKGQRGQPAPAA